MGGTVPAISAEGAATADVSEAQAPKWVGFHTPCPEDGGLRLLVQQPAQQLRVCRWHREVQQGER